MLGAGRRGVATSGDIGDGPHGSAGDDTGDFDFIKVTATAGQQLLAGTDTPSGPLDTVIGLYDAAGVLVGTDDDGGPGLDSLLDFTFTTSGTYYLLVSGLRHRHRVPGRPVRLRQRARVRQRGAVRLTSPSPSPDRDFYAVDLLAGDVLGASVTGRRHRGSPSATRPGAIVMGSDQDASFIYAPTSPLPGGGNAVADRRSPRQDGRYTVEVVGSAGTVRHHARGLPARPRGADSGTVQTLFLDFDGARVNTAIWGGPGRARRCRRSPASSAGGA